MSRPNAPGDARRGPRPPRGGVGGPPDVPREADVLRQVLEALRLFGVDVQRQNTGAFLNDQGQLVRCGEPGNADVSGMLTTGPGRGKKIDLETKRPGFDPQHPGNARARERWGRQLARLRRTNEQGGYGLWVTDASQVVHALRRINEGWRVVIDDLGYPHLTDEEA